MNTRACPGCEGAGVIRVYKPTELKAARKKAGLTQGELAARLGRGGVSTAYVSDVERGVAGFSARQARRWLAACLAGPVKDSRRIEDDE